MNQHQIEAIAKEIHDELHFSSSMSSIQFNLTVKAILDKHLTQVDETPDIETIRNLHIDECINALKRNIAERGDDTGPIAGVQDDIKTLEQLKSQGK